ncbi:hypothetical protein OS493_036165 [Desmophyllum pertusum]|uniref:Retrotransposon gag domain-containing protein n=1 Tax=Desmophyllum pertusum TaxID=174260 RepID=A0A9W9ZIF8_9CNID|nr:hypothetical protein OS493_036165 [Desmophyllum pertusum]
MHFNIICDCTCHHPNKTEFTQENRGSPRSNSPVSPSILQQEFSRLLNQAVTQAGHISPSTSFHAATPAGHISPSTSFQTAAQAGHSSPSTSFHAPPHTEEDSSSHTTPDNSDDSSSSSESESEHEEKDSTPLLLSASRGNKVRIQDVIENEKERTHNPTFSSRSSSYEDLTALNMDSHELSGIQSQLLDLQRKMTKHLDSQPLADYPAIADFSNTKPALFHGYESENVDRWLEKFKLHLSRRRINLDHDAAASELALHLAGPAEAFYYNLEESERTNFRVLSDALRERYSSRNHTWRLWQALSTRQQGTTEPLDKYIADLHAMFQHLHLSEEEKLRYFVQGLRPDIRREVLIKQPHTYREAEDAARLMQMVDSTVRSHDSTPTPINDKIIDAVIKATIAAQGSAQGHPEKKIAAYDFAPMPSEAEQLASLQQQVRQLTSLISGPQSIAAYQSNAPRESSYNRDSKDNEVARLKEENRQLKATLHESQPPRGGQTASYARNSPPQERYPNSRPPNDRNASQYPAQAPRIAVIDSAPSVDPVVAQFAHQDTGNHDTDSDYDWTDSEVIAPQDDVPLLNLIPCDDVPFLSESAKEPRRLQDAIIDSDRTNSADQYTAPNGPAYSVANEVSSPVAESPAMSPSDANYTPAKGLEAPPRPTTPPLACSSSHDTRDIMLNPKICHCMEQSLAYQLNC